MKLGKENSRKRWSELRNHWNDFDPIGVMSDPDWPCDEYNAYIGPTIRLLEKKATEDEILALLQWVISDRIGLRFSLDEAKQFATTLRKWFEENWNNSSV